MSRKHFVAIAAGIKAIEDVAARKLAAENMAAVCAKSNPRFDRARFMAACGV